MGDSPDAPICGARRREVNASRLPSSAISKNSPGKQEATSAPTRPLAELPGSRVGASRRGPSWHIRWPKSPLPHPNEQESFDAGEILHRESDPMQEKCRVCCRVSYRVPADEAIEA